MVFLEVKLDDLIPFLCSSPFGTIVRCCSCYVKKSRCGYLVAPPSGKPYICHMYYDLFYSVAISNYKSCLFQPDFFEGVKS